MLSGCVTPTPRAVYQVSINGLALARRPVAQSFVILPGEQGIQTNDLQFLEYAAIVERALLQRGGFHHADSFEKADVAVFLVYGIGEPKEHVFSYNLPVYGQTGVSSAATYGNAYGSAYRLGNTAYGSAKYSETTYYTPTYGITGYSTHVGTLVTYTRHIFLEAVDLSAYHKQNKIVQLWKTEVVSTGGYGDLRRVFPVMVAAAEDYFSVNTSQTLTVSVYEDDPRVELVKGVSALSK
jgi:hypothetical protein